MKGQTRNIYPGGNTPFGFYSYYNHILPQKEAKKFFCIKGGPGVGKSTLMKSISEHFLENGEAVDLMWCSSDPDSLDGILVRDRAVAIVDGTAPHIVDPKNPGAVDEIVNLGEYWDEREISKNRQEIISCNEKISEAFNITYGYLKCAWQQYEFMAEIINAFIPEKKLQEIKRELQMKLSSLSIIRRTESKRRKESALGIEMLPGRRKKFFAGAITPMGIKSELDSLTENISKVIVIDVPVGFRTERLLAPVAERLTSNGFDIEEYYCPMDPQCKLEHIISPAANLAIISCNRYHSIEPVTHGLKYTNITITIDNDIDPRRGRILEDLQNGSRENIEKALEFLKIAKEYHDILEEYYIPNMDFDKMERVKNEIIGKMESKVL